MTCTCMVIRLPHVFFTHMIVVVKRKSRVREVKEGDSGEETGEGRGEGRQRVSSCPLPCIVELRCRKLLGKSFAVESSSALTYKLLFTRVNHTNIYITMLKIYYSITVLSAHNVI